MNLLLNVFFLTYAYSQENCYNDTTYIKVNSHKNNITTLRLMETSTEKYSYNWNVHVKKTTVCRNLQRCNLLVWESARSLQRYLTNYKVDKKDPSVTIDDVLLMQGVEYTLNLTILGGESQINKQYILPLNETSNVPINGSNSAGTLNLLGANQTYANLDYFIIAYVNLCDKNVETYNKWKILDTKGNVFKNLDFIGNELTIATFSFEANSEYFVLCEVMSKNNTVLISGKHKVTVRKNELILKLNTISLLIGTNETIKLVAFVKDPDSKDSKFSLDWFCKINGTDCEDFEVHTAVLELENGFQEPGSYELTVQIVKDDEIKNETCKITVKQYITKSIKINEIPNIVNPSDGLEITARITNLITGCLLDWQSVEAADYEMLDLQTLPEYKGLENITLKDDAFLDELTEFSNDTKDKDYSLLIPPKSNDWEGLKGDSNYLFKIKVACPINNRNDVQEISAEVKIETNSPPALQNLVVEPETGYALTTNFKFKTEKAEDKIEDYPIFYSFGYIFNNKEIYFSKVGDVTSVQSILPYAENGIETILKACDNKNSCAQIRGPTIKLKLPEDFKEEQEEKFKLQFSTDLLKGDYRKAFIFSSMFLETYKSFNNDTSLRELEDSIVTNLNKEFEKLVGQDGSSDGFKVKASELIKHTKTLSDTMRLPEDLLQNIIKLRDKSSERLSEKIVRDEKKMRLLYLLNDVSKKEVQSLDDILSYLEISELIITTSSEQDTIKNEKFNLITNLNKFLTSLCSFVYERQKIALDFKTFNVALGKLSQHYFNSNVNVPTNDSWKEHMKIKFDKSWADYLKNRRICVANGIFRDYFHNQEEEEFSYFVDIFEAPEEINKIETLTKLTNSIIMKTNKVEHGCTVFYKNEWQKCKRTKIISTNIYCDCDYMGFYSLIEYVETSNSNNKSTRKQTITTFEQTTVHQTNLEDLTIHETTIRPLHINTDTTTKSNSNSNIEISKITDSVSFVTSTSSPNTTNIQKANVISGLDTGDRVSLIIICLSILGMILLAIIGAILNRIKRKRTVETSDVLEFPKYADIFHQETLENI